MHQMILYGFMNGNVHQTLKFKARTYREAFIEK